MSDSWDGQKEPVVLEKFNGSHNVFYNNWDSVAGNRPGDFELSGAVARMKFREFFRNYRIGNVYHYREALLRHWTQGLHFIEVDLAHVTEFDEILLNNLQVGWSLSFALFDWLTDTLLD
jgi:hypothetical protein